MTITIPDGFWDKYTEACDFFIDNDHIGRACTLVYPPKREDCINCVKPVGSISTNIYRHGGPMPFNFGGCPLCGGNGYKEVEVTDSIRLRIYWSRADWIRIASSVVAEDAEVMIIGYMSDLPNLRKAAHIILAKDNSEAEYRATVTGKPVPWGFGRNRYFVAYLKGA
jgi:hypothetical protein